MEQLFLVYHVVRRQDFKRGMCCAFSTFDQLFLKEALPPELTNES